MSSAGAITERLTIEDVGGDGWKSAEERAAVARGELVAAVGDLIDRHGVGEVAFALRVAASDRDNFGNLLLALERERSKGGI